MLAFIGPLQESWTKVSPAFQIRKVVVQDKVAKVAIGLAGGFCPGKGLEEEGGGEF